MANERTANETLDIDGTFEEPFDYDGVNNLIYIRNIDNFYTFGKALGKGSYGLVRKAKKIGT